MGRTENGEARAAWVGGEGGEGGEGVVEGEEEGGGGGGQGGMGERWRDGAEEVRTSLHHPWP